MTGNGRIDRRRILLVVVLGAVLLASTGVDVVVGTGDSMEPRYQNCDVLIVDTTRDAAPAVHVSDSIAYRSGSGLIVHEVVGVAPGEGYVWARGLNRDARDRVTSEMLVGVVVAHIDTSWVCSSGG